MPEHNQLMIRDLIYFDRSKAESILSQLEGGVISEIEIATDSTKENRNIRRYNFKLFDAEFGGSGTQNEGSIERRIRHHDLFAILEDTLFAEQLAVDVNGQIDPNDIGSGEARRIISQYGYLKATGWATVEDFRQIQFWLERINNIVGFINRIQSSESSDIQEVQNQIAALENELAGTVQSKIKQELKRKVREAQKMQEEILKQALGENQLADWYIEGLQNFVEVFTKHRLNLSIHPFEEQMPFYIVSNLKRDCFLDDDIANIIYAYGNRPNIKLSVFGLITSLPSMAEETPRFDKKYETSDLAQNSEQLVLEGMFASLFDAFENVGKFLSFSHFPNVTIYPIAVYREIKRGIE